MFSVFLLQLDDGCRRLYNVALKQNFEIHRLDMVIGKLHSLSGMDIIIRQLKIQKEELERQRRAVLEMLRALERIRASYSTAERKISENGEGNRVTYAYKMGVITFPTFWFDFPEQIII